MSAEKLLQEHLQSASFLSGQARGRWKLIVVTWPHALVEVFARDGRGFMLRFDCTGYPDVPPTATVWDVERDGLLDPAHWPRGGRVSQAFNPGWKNGSALYLPCDRQSIEGHPNWHNEYPWMIWKPARGLTQYLEAVYELLQSHELQPAGH
jgi:hypothetical protein